MTAKYKSQENEKPEQVNDPVVAYQRAGSDVCLCVPTEYEREIIMRSEKIMKKVGCILKKRLTSK